MSASGVWRVRRPVAGHYGRVQQGLPPPAPPSPRRYLMPVSREGARTGILITSLLHHFTFLYYFFLYVCDSELRSSCLKNVFDNLIHWTFSCEVTYGPIHGCSVIGIGLINRRCVYSLRPQDIARSRCRLAFVRALRGARPSSLRGFSWSQNNP